MSTKYLGKTFDIHGGGADLTFPHHENEIAQSEGASGKPFVRYWLHNGFVNVDHTKMSKSPGNVLLVRDLLKEAPGEVIRLALLSAHYRQPLDWTSDVLPEARRKLDRLYGALRDVPGLAGHGDGAAADRAGDALAGPGLGRPGRADPAAAGADHWPALHAAGHDQPAAAGLARPARRPRRSRRGSRQGP